MLIFSVTGCKPMPEPEEQIGNYSDIYFDYFMQLIVGFSDDKHLEIVNPELLTIKTSDFLRLELNQVYYTYLYDGKWTLGLRSCVPLDEEILSAFHEVLLKTYKA